MTLPKGHDEGKKTGDDEPVKAPEGTMPKGWDPSMQKKEWLSREELGARLNQRYNYDESSPPAASREHRAVQNTSRDEEIRKAKQRLIGSVIFAIIIITIGYFVIFG